MPAVARGQVITSSAPALDAWVQKLGVLQDPASLRFQAWDKTGSAPSQVFPSTGGTWHDVDLVDDRLGLGHFFPDWTVGGMAPLGLWEIRWEAELEDETTLAWASEFQVVATASLGVPAGAYCSVQDLKDEGVSSLLSDARLAASCVLAARFIEQVTGRFFEPRRQVLPLDGRGTPFLSLGIPIIAAEELSVSLTGDLSYDYGVDLPDLKVYNRHLVGLLNPDDRANPKIEYAGGHFRFRGQSAFRHFLTFPRGSQNAQLTGVFGFTDPDGSPYGRTPELLRIAAVKIALRESEKRASANYREDQRRGRVISEATRDQSYTLEGQGALRGNLLAIFTGDPSIDSILLMYKRPMQLGSA